MSACLLVTEMRTQCVSVCRSNRHLLPITRGSWPSQFRPGTPSRGETCIATGTGIDLCTCGSWIRKPERWFCNKGAIAQRCALFRNVVLPPPVHLLFPVPTPFNPLLLVPSAFPSPYLCPPSSLCPRPGMLVRSLSYCPPSHPCALPLTPASHSCDFCYRIFFCHTCGVSATIPISPLHDLPGLPPLASAHCPPLFILHSSSICWLVPSPSTSQAWMLENQYVSVG